jgi:hypothetical protein
VFVFALTTAAREVDAVEIVELILEVLPVTSDCIAKLPESRVWSERRRVPYDQTSAAVSDPPPLLVSVLVPLDQMSETNVPNVVKERDALDQTAVGIVATSDVEAVNTRESVLLLIVEIAVASCVLVFVFTLEATEVDAERTAAFVFEFTDEVPAAIVVPRDVEAVRIAELVFAFMLEVLPVTSLCTAKLPESRTVSESLRVAYVHTSAAVKLPPDVSVRVPLDQISETNVPNVVRERDALVQTPVGIVASNEVDAVRTVAFVFELIVETAEETCELVFAFTTAAIEVEAFRTVALVLALTEVVPAAIVVPRDVDAVSTAEFVFAFTLDVIPEV